MSVSTWILAQPLRTRRALALLGGPTLALTICGFVVEHVIRVYEAHQEWLASAEASVARDRGLQQAEPDLRRQLTEIERAPLLSRLYPAGAAGALATSLQADVGGALARAGITAQAISPLPSSIDDLIERAGVRVVLTLTIDQLRTFMSLIESHARLIRVEELIITAPQSQQREHNPTLNVTIVLLGFRLRQSVILRTGDANPAAPQWPR